MKKLRVVKIDKEASVITFDNGSFLSSNHDRECCEYHELWLGDITLDDFDGLLFDISNETLFTRIENYGIALNPINGFPIRIPGYGYNNGYYSDKLDLIIYNSDESQYRRYDITECQVIS